jgi:hypothetical protein
MDGIGFGDYAEGVLTRMMLLDQDDSTLHHFP